MAREHRARAAQLLQAARIPPHFRDCTFDTYPVSFKTAEALARARFVAMGPELDEEDEGYEEALDRWTDLPESMLLYGPFGTGKTGLAVSILRHRIESGLEDGLFVSTVDLLDAIRTRFNRDGTPKDGLGDDPLQQVKTVTVLVLDDLGTEKVTDWVQERLFAIINYRHDHELVTIFTSNLAPSELGEHIGERTMWRIVELCTNRRSGQRNLIKLDGPNLRA